MLIKNIDFWLNRLHKFRALAPNIAVVILADDPNLVMERPALRNIKYIERLTSENELNELSKNLLENGLSVRIVFGILSFMSEAAIGTLFPSEAPIKIVIDKTEGGGHSEGFGPARRSTVALLCNQYGFHYPHSDAYASAISRHKHHQTMLLHQAGIPAPRTWSYRPQKGWLTGSPPTELKIICKSTYEAWSIGVSENTVRLYDAEAENVICELAMEIGQPVCVQEFIDGPEIYSIILDPGEPVCIGFAEAYASGGSKKNGQYIVFDDHFSIGGIAYRDASFLDQDIQTAISDVCLRTFELMSMSYVGRIDCRISNGGTPYVIDIADNPGTSSESSLAFILTSMGFELDDLPILLLSMGLEQILENTIKKETKTEGRAF